MEWITIISGFLLPMLARCQQQFSSEPPVEYLKSHYDSETGRMDASLVRNAMPHTRRAIRKAFRSASIEDRRDFPRYTREDVYNMAESELIKAMSASPEQVESVMEASRALGDEE